MHGFYCNKVLTKSKIRSHSFSKCLLCDRSVEYGCVTARYGWVMVRYGCVTVQLRYGTVRLGHGTVRLRYCTVALRHGTVGSWYGSVALRHGFGCASGSHTATVCYATAAKSIFLQYDEVRPKMTKPVASETAQLAYQTQEREFSVSKHGFGIAQVAGA